MYFHILTNVQFLCQILVNNIHLLGWVKSFVIFLSILVFRAYITWLTQFKPWELLIIISNIVVVGALTHYALLHSVCDLKSAQRNMQPSLIQEFMLYDFKVGHNADEATKNISCVKSEGTVNRKIVIRWFKKFHSGAMNLDYPERSGRPKIMNSKILLKATEANLVSRTWRVSGKFSISPSTVVRHLHNFTRSFRIVPHILPKYCKTFDSPQRYLTLNVKLLLSV